MVDRFKDRIKILEDQEIEELYGRPRFNHEERLHFFSLSSEERALADTHHNLANSVLFILQLGYFKARTMSFPLNSKKSGKMRGISCSSIIRETASRTFPRPPSSKPGTRNSEISWACTATEHAAEMNAQP
jgi:Domain of unknown function (DUF4158)